MTECLNLKLINKFAFGFFLKPGVIATAWFYNPCVDTVFIRIYLQNHLAWSSGET